MDTSLVRCPACGGRLNVDGATEFVRCEYCENTVSVRRRAVNADGSLSVTDAATGLVLGSVRLPFGYTPAGALVPQASSYTYPFGVSMSAHNDKGDVLSYFIGEGFTDRSKCPALSGMYSQGLEQVSRTHYRDFTDAARYADGYLTMYAKNSGATAARFVEERSMPLYEPFDESGALETFKRKMAFEAARSGNAGKVQDVGHYLKGVCRVYDMDVAGATFRVAVATVVAGWKYRVPGVGGGFGGFGGFGAGLGGLGGGVLEGLAGALGGGLGGGLGNALGSIFGGNTSHAQPQAPAQQPASTDAFANMPANCVIEWLSDGVFVLQCLPQNFDATFRGAFTDFCSTLRLDHGIREKQFNMQSQILQDIARHTQQRIDQMNREFQSWQQINAAQQAAFDSANQAWWARENASDAARRARYQESMASAGGAADFSEAMRGVNTYVRPDGTEVEVSVAYDRAYTNNLGDTLASASAFEPAGNWTEMQRAR